MQTWVISFLLGIVAIYVGLLMSKAFLGSLAGQNSSLNYLSAAHDPIRRAGNCLALVFMFGGTIVSAFSLFMVIAGLTA
ncbi:hypothetical protein A2415_02535 [candidate division WWE3 bacterium RIFOXYC1_FULL_39_7]|uniref:Uncharacterized protein n=2 Tax=Katanobacteria TaxID=422282 RepID=A0A1F4X693_UNCKA|nr:MAG: hypothetical protein A2415_02535 [candidate division WWE3 bacterium RIFOXYC1_FULL_39_7]OGC77071.1 MAG: hypothetical protein A2619_01605 [candidate division WWE3 bacterium RIFOXYD1_FULL_39_9]